jgi:hypothetical protein
LSPYSSHMLLRTNTRHNPSFPFRKCSCEVSRQVYNQSPTRVCHISSRATETSANLRRHCYLLVLTMSLNLIVPHQSTTSNDFGLFYKDFFSYSPVSPLWRRSEWSVSL